MSRGTREENKLQVVFGSLSSTVRICDLCQYGVAKGKKVTGGGHFVEIGLIYSVTLRIPR